MSLPELDTNLFLFVNRGLQNGLFDHLMPFITRNVWMVFLALVLPALIKEKRDFLPVLAVSLLSVAFADASSHLLKDIFMRQRPCNALPEINLLVGCGKAFSMPSNHASNAFAFAVTIGVMRKNILSAFFIACAVVISFSRVYVGVHYPGDVIMGAFLGSAIACGSVSLYHLASKIYAERNYGQLLLLLISLLSLFRIYYIITGPFDLTPDEAHYWEWSRRPDWSYYSKGPMTAYLILIGTKIFGNTVLGVRFFAVVLSAMSSILLFRLGKELFDEKTGYASALLIQIIPLFSVFGMLLTIDSPFMFFWILCLYIFHRILRQAAPPSDRKPSLFSWLLLGACVGAGLLTKYTMAFFPFSAFLFLMFSRDSRRLLKTPGPYLAAVVSIAVFSPVIFWNASNGWVTVKHTAGQAHIQEGLVISLRSFGEFAGSQFLVMTPLLFALVMIAVLKLKPSPEGSLLFWFFLPTTLFFALKSIQGKVQANWAMTGYLSALVAFSAYYLRDIGRFKKAYRAFIVGSMALSFLLALFAHFPSVLRLPEGMDPSVRLLGWRELGREASLAYRDLSQSGPAFVFSDSYQVSSELAFYMEGNPVTYCVNLGRRMNQYDLWPGFEDRLGQSALFVRTKEKGLPGELAEAFSSCQQEVITVTTRQKKAMKFTFFTCYDFRGLKTGPVERY